MERTETIEERNERWEKEKKLQQARKSFMNILEENAGMIYDNLKNDFDVNYGVEPADTTRGFVSKKYPLYQILFNIMFDADADSLVSLRKIILDQEKIETNNVNALSIINELVVMDNKLNNGEHKETLRAYAKECTDRSLKGQVNIVEPASEALEGKIRR